MTYYTLYNSTNDRCLKHPSVGAWYTSSKEEAEEMLKACHEYVSSMGWNFLVETIGIKQFSKLAEIAQQIK